MLLIDAGNTRCKFAWWDKHTDSIQWLGAIEHQHWLNDLSRSLKDILLGVINSEQLEDTKEALGVSVASVQVVDTLNQSLAELGINVRWQSTRATQLGVVNAYREKPEALGADRWLALLGCHKAITGHAVIIDAGTALTVDWLTRDGQHLGGWIVPGRQLMLNALGQGTAQLGNVPIEQSAQAKLEPGVSTREGMLHGIEASLIGVVYEAAKLSPSLFNDETFTVVVTGGDSEQLASHLSGNICRIDDLTFKGLRLCADNGQ